MTKRERKGEIFMILLAFFESWFPIIVIFTYQYITPLYAYSLNIFFAGLILSFFSLYKNKLHDLKNKKGLRDLLLTSFFITILFLFVFLGLKYTTASNMAVILFLQLFFSFLYFNVIGDEYISKQKTAGAFLMGAGAVAILHPENLEFNKGDILILLAAMIAPAANYYQKKARKYYPSHMILSVRYILSLPVLFLLAFLMEPLPLYEDILNALPYVLLSGFVIMGLAKILWVEAIYNISITKASALGAAAPVFTIFFAYIVLNETPAKLELLSIIPVLLGGYLITRKDSYVQQHRTKI